MRKRLLALILASAGLNAACIFAFGVAPSSANANIVVIIGTWSGTTSDSAGSATGVWTLTQNGTDISGTVRMSDNARDMAGNGTMRGALNGRSLSFRMEIPPGGFDRSMTMCSMVIDGEATMSDDGRRMTGSYTGSLTGMMGPQRSCGGSLSRGTFSMTR